MATKKKRFRDLLGDMSPEDLKEIDEMARELRAEMPLHELRRARHFTQVQIASSTGKSQAEISQMEHRTDVYLSTLRTYIEAMGGELSIVAEFPEGAYRINQFERLATSGEHKTPTNTTVE